MKLQWTEQEVGFPWRWRRETVHWLRARIGMWFVPLGYVELSLRGFRWVLRIGSALRDSGRCTTLEEAQEALLDALGVTNRSNEAARVAALAAGDEEKP